MDDEKKLEIHARVMAVKRDLEQDKLRFANEQLSSDFFDSWEKIRYGDDGIVDPDTVDGRIRAMGMVILYHHQRLEAKQAISQLEIQKMYFEILEANFGSFYEAMIEHGLTPHDVAESFLSDQNRKEVTIKALPDFFEALTSFWEAVYFSSWVHEEETEHSKAIFGGAIFPDDSTNIASQLGLYFDTIVVFDPLSKVRTLMFQLGPEKACFDTIVYALRLLEFKPLILAELDPPILIVMPEKIYHDVDYRPYLDSVSIKSTTKLLSEIFKQPFENEDSAHEFLKDFDTAEKILKATKKQDYIIFEKDDPRPLDVQLQDYIKTYSSTFDIHHPGEALFLYLKSRMMQAEVVLDYSTDFHGTPLIQAPVSWDYFNFLLEVDAVRGKATDKLHITKALSQTDSKDMSWLGNIPMGSLVELRRAGATDEIKEIINKDIQTLLDMDSSNFEKTTNQVFSNLEAAFVDHQKRLKEIDEKFLKKFGLNLAGTLVSGAIHLAAAHLPPLVTTISGMAGLPTAKEVVQSSIDYAKEKRSAEITPVGMLVRAKR